MNLNNSPTLEQLQELTRVADDRAGHHILWVNASGDVRLTRLPQELSPNGFEDSQPKLRIRYETFNVGCGYVGPEAADDVRTMQRLFSSLVKEWAGLKPSDDAEYVDSW